MTAPPRTVLRLSDGPGVCSQYDVYLDGVKQNACTEANAEGGYVLRYKRNVFGAPALNRSKQPVIVRVNGKVDIVPKGVTP
jgi:hypothetical protein